VGNSYEYFMAYSEIIFTIIQYTVRLLTRTGDGKLRHLKEGAHSLLKEGVENAANLISWDLARKEHTMDPLFKLSPVFAFLVYYSKGENKELFQEERLAFINYLLKSYVNINSEEGYQIHKKSNLYKYIKLFGAWIYKYYEADAINDQIIAFLAEHYKDNLIDKRSYTYSDMDKLGYPTDHIAGEWYIYPSEFWGSEQWPITNELNNIDLYSKYNDIIVEKFNKQ
jgi:hypothetical protein